MLEFPAFFATRIVHRNYVIQLLSLKDAGMSGDPLQQFLHMRHDRYFWSLINLSLLFFVSHGYRLEKRKLSHIQNMQRRDLKVVGMSA